MQQNKWEQIMRLTLGITIFLIGGCAYNSGVIPLDKDEFMIANQGSNSFTSLPKLREEARQQGIEYCESLDKQISIVRFDDAEGPFVGTSFPRTDFIFRCDDAPTR